jgi:hypothetical protein
MIPISEVIEACAQMVEGFDACDPKHIAEAIRALAAKYEGCVVAEATPVYLPQHRDEFDVFAPLYRAKEAK